MNTNVEVYVLCIHFYVFPILDITSPEPCGWTITRLVTITTIGISTLLARETPGVTQHYLLIVKCYRFLPSVSLFQLVNIAAVENKSQYFLFIIYDKLAENVT